MCLCPLLAKGRQQASHCGSCKYYPREGLCGTVTSWWGVKAEENERKEDGKDG